MDFCTVAQFNYGVTHPEESFNTLSTMVLQMQTLCCHKHFAECMATIGEEQVLIYVPITHDAMEHITNTRLLLHSVGYPYPQPEVLPFELNGNSLQGRSCSVVIEHMGDAESLALACKRHTRLSLMAALDDLQRTMRHLDISHKNLTTNNIAVTADCRMYPLRPYYTEPGYGNDTQSFTNIESYILSHTSPSGECCTTLHEELSAYTTSPENPLVEGLRRIRTSEGVGFENAEGGIVVECRYLSAEDFYEGRSVVTTHQKRMGLIDKSGKEIIAANYEQVNYDKLTGNSWVRRQAEWALFDYFGLQITDWQSEDVLDAESIRLSQPMSLEMRSYRAHEE